MVKSSNIDEAWRLLAIDGLLEMAVKKSVLHVQLMDQPSVRSRDAEDGPDGGRLDNRVERLVVVNVMPLGEVADHP